MAKIQVYESDGKALFTDDFEIEHAVTDGSVISATINQKQTVEFNNWKRAYWDYADNKHIESVTIFY